jgi:proteic killer suppression protein
MISCFRDDWLRAFFVDDARSRNIPSELESRLFRKLQMVEDATSDLDLRVPAEQPFRKVARQAGRFSFDPRQQAISSFNGMAAEAKRRPSISTTAAIREVMMLMTKRRPVGVREILVQEFNCRGDASLCLPCEF